MANSFTLAKNYVNLLDKVYQKASVTQALSGDPAMTRAGSNANEIVYPQIGVSGLGDYSRSSGYTDNSVTVTWKTVEFNYDRGTKIQVDTMDNEETFNIAFGQAGAELMRTKVAVEADAFCFATLAGTTGISKAADATLADANSFLTALIAAKNVMDEDEVPDTDRYLYATPTLMNSILSLDTTKSREILATFAMRQAVPQARFYTAIDLNDGKSAGEEAGHFAKATAGKDINFMIVHKPAIIKFDKHIANDLITPSANQSADAYMLKYRKYGLVDVYNNKVAGVYLHSKAS